MRQLPIGPISAGAVQVPGGPPAGTAVQRRTGVEAAKPARAASTPLPGGNSISRKAAPAAWYAVRAARPSGSGWKIDLAAQGALEPVGSVQLTPSKQGVYISNLKVAPEHRRQGLATQLIDAALRTATSNGYRTARLEARPDSPADLAPADLVSMYQKLGFRRTGISQRGNPVMERGPGMAPPPGREAPPVYRPHAAAVSQLKSKPAAPPVYRPQAAVSQLKLKPAAPPVYRPQAAVSQLKPAAPPVYRPQPTVSQPKFAGAMTAANARTPVPASWNGAPKFEPAAPSSAGKMVLPGLAHPALRTNAIQRMQDSESDSDSGSGDDYTEEERKKQLRFGFLAGTPQTVIENTAHQVAHFDTGRFTAVWTCPNCQRMLAYTDLAGTFHLSEYGYMSVNENEHRQRALELDHHPPWAPRLASLERRGASRAEMREDYQDEGRLRALCRVCNGKHNLEGKQVKNYDSDDDDFNPQRTPKHETQYNTGQFSGYRPDDYFS